MSLLMYGVSLFSHLSSDQQKDEYLCSFLEAVPKLVILRQSLQLVVRLLLRPAAAAAAAAVVIVVVVFSFILLPKIRLQNR